MQKVYLSNATRKIINNKWMLEESKNKQYIILNGFKVFVGLPVICKKTKDNLFNNEEFVVVDVNRRIRGIVVHHFVDHFVWILF